MRPDNLAEKPLPTCCAEPKDESENIQELHSISSQDNAAITAEESVRRVAEKLKKARKKYRRAKPRRIRTISPVSVIAQSLRPQGHSNKAAKRSDPSAILLQWIAGYVEEPGTRPRAAQRAETVPPPANTALDQEDLNPARISDAAEHSRTEKFWRVWIEHSDSLRKQTLKLMRGNQTEAEDALSVAALKACNAYQPGKIRNERAWLARIVYTACMDHYRSQKRQGALAERERVETVDLHQNPTTRQGRSPEEEFLGSELLAEFLQHMLNLPNSLLAPLLMRCLDGMAYSDIAEELEVTNDTARKRVELARRKLRASGYS